MKAVRRPVAMMARMVPVRVAWGKLSLRFSSEKSSIRWERVSEMGRMRR